MLIVDVKQFITKADGTRAYVWKTVPVAEALKIAEPRLRCPECKGAVGLFRSTENGAMPNRAEHKKRNKGCSLGDCFTGVKQPADVTIEPDQESYAG